ncbi:endolytic transglycosylase MltG [Fundicoccus sp. Sow4_D5]|uniref:endolytic transglycosylase MltG n=1 Tax=unclassified Fundicoccus TaxID=2761543 RepID=UPI003F930972
MNKSSLRSLALGFLASGIITGAYAIFFQGHVPVQGITVPTVLTSNSVAHEEELAKYREEMSSLITERDALEEDLGTKDEEIASLTQKNTGLESQVAELQLENRSVAGEDTDSEDETTEANSEETSEDESENTAAEGSFVIAQGETSVDIASNLEAAGFVESASEFQALLDEWGLSSIIQAGTYELTADMSIHDIANELTHGAYYYY